MSILGIFTISRLISGLAQVKFNDNSLPRIPGGIFFIHSIKTPLTSLQLNLELLEKVVSEKKDEELKASLDSALQASKQITELVTSIPQFNKLDLDMELEVAQTLETLKILYKNQDETYKLVFNIKLKDNQEKLKINKLYFVELISCLIKNGFEAYEDSNMNKVVIVTAIEKNKQLHIQVQDFGQGINPLKASLASVNGFTTKEQGHGFGMWFVKRIVEGHFKSKLKIISEKNGGTLIRFWLPVT